jgi:hypothetical protein
MKKSIITIVTIAFLIYPSACLSSYLVKLKNGSEFITNNYWEEDGQIKFYSHGGIAGIDKNMIHEISESDLPYIIEQPQPAKKTKPETKSELNPKKPEEPPVSPAEEVFIKEKIIITTQMETVSTAFKKAKAEKNRREMDEQWEKLLSLQKELSALSDKVKTSYGDKIPENLKNFFP